MTLGEKTKHFRNQNGWTQEKLRQILGVQKSAIHKYEQGIVSNISITRLEELAKAFNIPIAYLTGDLDKASIDNIKKTDYPSTETVKAKTPNDIISEKINKLSSKNKRLICELIDTLLEIQK